MGFMDEELWTVMENKVREEDKKYTGNNQKIGNKYICAVEEICKYGVQRAETIRDTFPMYTLHNETHICNVMRLMADLLGNRVEDLSRDEAAMLIMAACCHDIGMSCSKEEKEKLRNNDDRLMQYLNNNDSAYVQAAHQGNGDLEITDDMIQNYLRSIHHERVGELLLDIEWPGVLAGRIDREDLIRVCQSHGKNISDLDQMDATTTIDLRFCAILLRLADILDFDTSRAPEAIYRYSGFQKANDPDTLKSKEEWDKHLASQGFDFSHIGERIHMYPLGYSATCKSMQVEHTVKCFLDWVDQELTDCSRQLNRFTGKWQDFILPGKIKRNIKAEGYVSGQFLLTLEPDKILELLVGKDLYSDPAVFVRKLIQNAIDAVRAREQLDKNLPKGWKGQINIRCWMDPEGYHWFRIEDNGIGMTEDIIKNYFLKIGSSYYSSDAFLKSKLQCNADPDFMPISRFGIGILSCFMGDKETNQIEVSTKHFREGDNFYPALRLSMHGIKGYYYLASEKKGHMPGPMKGVGTKEKETYLTQAGTAIAVRTNLYQTGKYRGFKEIVDKYVICPPVAIHYDGEEGSYDYPTEADFMNCINAICSPDGLGENGEKEFQIPNEALNELHSKVPIINFEKPPKLLLKCVSLEQYTSKPFLKGALLTAEVEGGHNPINLKLGNRDVKTDVKVGLHIDEKRERLGIKIGLNFDDNFKRQMEMLNNKYSKPGHWRYDLEEKMALEGDYNDLDKAVLRKILKEFTHIDEDDWKTDIIRKYEITEEKLEETIDEVIGFINSYDHVEMKYGDAKSLKAYKTFKQEWIFDICSLSGFKWYNRFRDIINKSGKYSIAAHNGIFCGDADFFFVSESEKNLGTIILLKDKYRPYLDATRDGVRGITLELTSEMEVIKNNLKDEGYRIKGHPLNVRKENAPYIVMEDYCEILKQREDLAKQLIFNTEGGLFSNENLSEKFQEYGKIRHQALSKHPAFNIEGENFSSKSILKKFQEYGKIRYQSFPKLAYGGVYGKEGYI